MSYLPLNPSIRNLTNPLQLKGGLAFDGVTTTAKDLHTIGANIGTSDLTYYAEFQVPSSNPSSTIGLLQLGSVSSTHISTSALSVFISSAGTLFFTLYGPSSTGDFIQDSIASFVSSYAGKVVSLAVVKNSTTPSLTVYVNGVVVATSSSSAGGITWGATVASTYCNVGSNGGSTYSGNVLASRIFTRALTASEVVDLANKGVSEGDKWGSLTAKIGGTTQNGNFEAGSGTTFTSWSAGASITVAEETVDMHSGTRCPKITGAGTPGSSAFNWFACNTITSGPLQTAKRYRYSVWLKRVSGTDTGYIANGFTTLATVTNASVWLEYTGEFTTSTDSTLRNTIFNFASAPGSVWLIDDVTVTQIGCLLDPDLANADPATGNLVMDRSSNGYTGVVSQTGVSQVQRKSIQIYGDQTTANIVNNTAVSARAMRGGLAFDGVTNAKDLHTISSNIGTSDFSVRVVLEVPASNPSASYGVLTLSSSSTDNAQTGVYFIYIATDGSINAATRDATAGNQLYSTVSGFVSAYGGKTVEVMCVRNATTPSHTWYINGVATTATASGGGGGATTWANSIISTYAFIGQNTSSTLFKGNIYSAQLFNRALSASEVIDLANKGVAESDKWGSLTAKYSSTFAVDVDGWAQAETTLTYNATDPASVTGTLKVERTAAGSGRIDISKIATSFMTIGKRYKITAYLYNVNITPSYFTFGNAGNAPIAGTNVSNIPIGTGGTISGEIIWSTASSLRVGSASSTDGSNGGSVPNGSIYYIKNIVVTELGCLLDPDLSVGVGYQVPDRSSNHYDGLLSTTGVSHTVAKQSGQARFSLSADGYLGDTTSRACIPADSFIDSITAYSTGTPTFTVGDDSGSAANVIGSTTLSASTVTVLGTSGIPLKRFLTTGTKGRVYVDFTAGAAATTFTINYSTTGNY